MNEPGPARDYHRLTVHDPSGRRPHDERLVVGYRPLQWDLKPPQFKTYPHLEVTPLPEDLLGSAPGELDARALSRLLFLSAGVVRVMHLPGGPLWFRAAGSAGNLSPVEVYLVTGGLAGVEPGVHHYEPVEHGLTRVGPVPAGTPPSLVLTGVPWRTAWKYRERGFRHLYWDAGTMLAHTLELADEAGLQASVELGFVDEAVARLVGADAVHELPLAVVPLSGASRLPEPDEVGHEAAVGHVAADPLEFPLITETQQAGALATQADVVSWRRAAAELAPAPASKAGAGLTHALDYVIRGRGSTRRFDRDASAPEELLTGAMAWATRAVPGDFVSPGATLLEHNLAVHAVDGAEPGAYRWEQGALNPVRTGPVRDVAAHLCLDQALAADGVYTAFHCSDLEAVTARLGSRGYRAAHLEAGITEGRLHLFAFGRGFGATGLTFYDHEVSRFFETEALPLLVTAVGAPAYRSRPGGLPRQPVAMRPR